MFEKRSTEQEYIDHKKYHHDEYYDCLTMLDRIGRWLGGYRATYNVLKKMKPLPESILDIGCGGGLFDIRLAKKMPNTRILGIDINPQAIHFAKYHLSKTSNKPKNLKFEKRLDIEIGETQKSYDVVMCNAVCHHMTNYQIVEFISCACQVARRKVIINDLHRHPAAYYLFKWINPIFFRNRLVRHDGPISVKRAFIYDDWVHYLKQAGIKPENYTIKWKWAFRWVVEINCS